MGSKRIEPRIEHDLLGSIQIPANSYWGGQTARAREQLFSCGWKAHPKLLEAIILVKKAAAVVNSDLGRLDTRVAGAVAQVCDEVLSGQWIDQFIAEPLQSGAGTALNMNVNEVLANRAEELLGGFVGEYKIVDPYLHVNLGQSAYDLFPTAMRLAVLNCLKEFEPALLDLERLLRRKALEFAKILKIGRTHLRDTVPITLGQEFNTFGSTVERGLKRLKDASNGLLELNIGGTYVGSGWEAHPAFHNRMIETLSAFTKNRLKPGEDLLRLTQSMTDFVHVSSALRELALDLNKLASDLRLLNSGPETGFGEIILPAVEATPSPMLPGVLPNQSNPVLAESLNMVCFQVMGNDTTILLASQAGQLQGNSMAAVVAQNLLQSIDLLRQGVYAFNQKCLSGITANAERCQRNFALSGALFTALSEQIGLASSKALLERFEGNGENLLKALSEGNLIPQSVLEKILSSTYLTVPGIRPRPEDVIESAS